MKIGATREEALAILAAMRDVSGLDRALTEADRASLVAAAHWIFGIADPVDADRLPAGDPATLAAALETSALREEAIRFIAVSAFVDGSLDPAKIRRVLAYAAAVGVEDDYIDEITEAAKGNLQWALGHMVRDNLESITGKPWADGPNLDAEALAFLLPYGGDKADPALAARFRALSALPDGSFGRAFLDHFDSNGYALPGEPDALNLVFSLPHDSSHVFAGYDTTPRGELLVSTFTAAMHPVHPISGHVLPVIFSWHLGIKINDVAKSAEGAMDPSEFWHAWARGEAMKIDIFGPDWDFWAWAGRPLADLRRQYLGDG